LSGHPARIRRNHDETSSAIRWISAIAFLEPLVGAAVLFILDGRGRTKEKHLMDEAGGLSFALSPAASETHAGSSSSLQDTP